VISFIFIDPLTLAVMLFRFIGISTSLQFALFNERPWNEFRATARGGDLIDDPSIPARAGTTKGSAKLTSVAIFFPFTQSCLG